MIVEQGDIIALERMNGYFLVVSKNFFNATEQAVLCPIVKDTFPDPLHVNIQTDEAEGGVMCEQMSLVDLRYRRHKKVSRISYGEIINITDIIQGIFDY